MASKGVVPSQEDQAKCQGLLEKVANKQISVNQAARVAETSEKIRMEQESGIPAAGGHGGKRKDGQVTIGHLSEVGGNSRERRIAQLKKAGRDDLVEKVISGEMSANAAATEAGLRKPPKPELRPTRSRGSM